MKSETSSSTSNSIAMRFIFIAVALFSLYFAGLGSYPLIDPDEPVYGQVAKEMAKGAGWLTPHYNGHMWFDKPPLFYWLSGACASIFGPTEFASRLPSALLAIALLFLVYKLASYDFGKRVGLFSTVAMATCLQQIVLARAAVTDMTLAVCLTAALLAYRHWLDANGKARFGWMALCGAATGLGMLAKGPVAPLLLFATFFAHLWWSKRLKRLLSFDALVGIIAMLAVGLPWYAAMYTMHHDAFMQGFIMQNNITRFLKPEHAKQTGGWTSYFRNIPVLMLMFFPWSIFLIQAMRRFWQANDGTKLASVWFAVVFVFFSISKTQLITYIFPLYPAAALFVGILLNSAASNDKWARLEIEKGLKIALAVSLLIAVGLSIVAHKKYPEAMVPATVLGVVLLVTFALSVFKTRTKHSSSPAWIIGTGMAAFTLWLVYGVMPVTSPRVCERDLINQAPQITKGRVVLVGVKLPSILFYHGFEPEIASAPKKAGDEAACKLKRLLANSEPTAIICKEKLVSKIVEPDTVVLAKSGGRVIIANPAAKGLMKH